MEAEKYKGSWIRQKKRVADLELHQQKQPLPQKQNETNVNNQSGMQLGALNNDGRMLGHPRHNWGISSDVELRKVTPSISHEENQPHHHDSINNTRGMEPQYDSSSSPPKRSTSSASKKRKQRESSKLNTVAMKDVTRFLPQHSMDKSLLGESVSQRLAKHLLNQNELRCYSLRGNAQSKLFVSSLFDNSHHSAMNVDANLVANEGKASPHQSHDARVKEEDAMQKLDVLNENETQAFVKSILYQMACGAPSALVPGMQQFKGNNLSVSGLVHVLMERFNSLFRVKTKADETSPLDGDGDHVMGQENGTNQNVNASGKTSEIQYQKMALVIAKDSTSTIDESSDNFSPSQNVIYATVSWRATLYLLHVLHDILLLSEKARGDLRWWFYQSRQSEGDGGSRSIVTSPNATQDGYGGGKDGNGDVSRIEGLPARFASKGKAADEKEALWTKNCQASPRGQSNDWDPLTMAQPCNIFFDLLVGLMKGNIYEHPNNDTPRGEESNSGIEQVLVQLVQIKAIELVLALMSDAPRFDQAEDNYGNRTPYLWKFWFDSLLPSYSTGQAASNDNSSDEALGDFLSPLEKNDSQFGFLGSGRKHLTRLLKDAPDDDMQQNKRTEQKQGRRGNKRSAEKQGRDGKRSSRGSGSTSERRDDKIKWHELHGISQEDEETQQLNAMAAAIKGRILQLLSHFMISSSSVNKTLYQVVNKSSNLSLAKRVLAAVLDEVEEYILPFLSAGPPRDDADATQCLQLCNTCLEFILIVTKSNKGIRLLRLQMRLESEQDESSRWSQSAIGCMISLLDNTLSYAAAMEEHEGMVLKSTDLSHVLNAVVDQCILFFKAVLLFACEQRDTSSKAATFLALISEHRTVFQSCCQRILFHQSSLDDDDMAGPPRVLHFSESLRYDVRQLFEETVFDERDENETGK